MRGRRAGGEPSQGDGSGGHGDRYRESDQVEWAPDAFTNNSIVDHHNTIGRLIDACIGL
jgi:hypothetical protein